MPEMRTKCKITKSQKRFLIPGTAYTPGDKKKIKPEANLDSVEFNIFKFNNRTRPKDKKKIIILFSFYEFGTEVLSALYCFPRFIHLNPGYYVIVAGWYGREYLYRHLADEFWELKEEYQWLREYADSYRHDSKNLKILSDKLSEMGVLATGKEMSHFCLGHRCLDCNHYFMTQEYFNPICAKCQSANLSRPLLSDVKRHRKLIHPLPVPSIKMLAKAKQYLKPNPVGIFARGRTRYGRNLQPEFYVKLIKLLEHMGYNPIWLGEKQSILPCPVDHIVDFSRMPESRDLELTLAIVSQLKFTIQYWTASTRLASMVGTPWILFESPDQLVGHGQEGIRIALTTDWNKKKIVLANYMDVFENHEMTLGLTQKSIQEIQQQDFSTIVGMVENKNVVNEWLKKFNYWWDL